MCEINYFNHFYTHICMSFNGLNVEYYGDGLHLISIIHNDHRVYFVHIGIIVIILIYIKPKSLNQSQNSNSNANKPHRLPEYNKLRLSSRRCLPRANFDLDQSAPIITVIYSVSIGWVKSRVWQPVKGKNDTNRVQLFCLDSLVQVNKLYSTLRL